MNVRLETALASKRGKDVSDVRRDNPRLDFRGPKRVVIIFIYFPQTRKDGRAITEDEVPVVFYYKL